MTMKRYIYILFAGALLSLTSCVVDNTFSEQNVYVPNADRGLKIIGSVEDFDKVDVGTRAEKVGFSDSHISEMTMFIFKGNDNHDLIQGYNANQEPVSSAVNIRKSTPTFLVDTSKYDGTGIITSMDVGVDIRYYDNNEDDLGACSIYIVANAYHFLNHILTATMRMERLSHWTTLTMYFSTSMQPSLCQRMQMTTTLASR